MVGSSDAILIEPVLLCVCVLNLRDRLVSKRFVFPVYQVSKETVKKQLVVISCYFFPWPAKVGKEKVDRTSTTSFEPLQVPSPCLGDIGGLAFLGIWRTPVWSMTPDNPVVESLRLQLRWALRLRLRMRMRKTARTWNAISFRKRSCF